MELKLPNPDAKDYCEGVGISSERQQELSKALDAMVQRLNSGPMILVAMHHTFSEIASFCNGPEELIYCTVLHCAWHHRRGRILAPGPVDYDNIADGIGVLNDRLGKEDGCVRIINKLGESMHSEKCKQGAREGVQYLLDSGEIDLAKDVINRLTGYAF